MRLIIGLVIFPMMIQFQLKIFPNTRQQVNLEKTDKNLETQIQEELAEKQRDISFYKNLAESARTVKDNYVKEIENRIDELKNGDEETLTKTLTEANNKLLVENLRLSANLNDLKLCIEAAFESKPFEENFEIIMNLEDTEHLKLHADKLGPFKYMAFQMIISAWPGISLMSDLNNVLMHGKDTFHRRRARFIADLVQFNQRMIDNGKPWQQNGEHILNLGQVRNDLQSLIGFRRGKFKSHDDYTSAIVYIDGANIGRQHHNCSNSVREDPNATGNILREYVNGKCVGTTKPKQSTPRKPIDFKLITDWILLMIDEGFFRKFIVVLQNDDLFSYDDPKTKIALNDPKYQELQDLAKNDERVEIVELDGYDDLYISSMGCSYNAVVFSGDEFKEIRYNKEEDMNINEEHWRNKTEKGNVVKFAFGNDVDQWLSGGCGRIFHHLKPQYDPVRNKVNVRIDGYGYNGYSNAALVANRVLPLKKKPHNFQYLNN